MRPSAFGGDDDRLSDRRISVKVLELLGEGSIVHRNYDAAFQAFPGVLVAERLPELSHVAFAPPS